MKSGSPRFSTETIAFLKKAGKQKNPDWLKRNQEAYDLLVRDPLQHFARELKIALQSKAPAYHFPQKGIGRIKRPGGVFKNWISYTATRPSGSRFDHNPSLFFMINSADAQDPVLIAGGLYMPSSRQLRAIREAVAQDAGPFERLFASRAFAQAFPGGFSRERQSSRPPRGFNPDHPKLDWLKLQGYFVWKPCRIKDFTSTHFAASVARDFEQALKLNALLESVIQAPSLLIKKGPTSIDERLDEFDAPQRPMDF